MGADGLFWVLRELGFWDSRTMEVGFWDGWASSMGAFGLVGVVKEQGF